MSYKFKIYAALFLMATCFIIPLQAQEKKNKRKNKDKTEEATKKVKTIEDLTKKSQKIEGLFTVYRDTLDGSTMMLITKDQLKKDYIHFSQIMNGVNEGNRYVRGSYMGSKIFQIKKDFNKIEFITQNVHFYFDPQNALSRSSEANISNSIMASVEIAAVDTKKGHYLIKSDDLFLTESFKQILRAKHPKESPMKFKLGKLSKDKTKIASIKNYAKNLNVKTNYVYNNPTPLNQGSEAITDARNVTIQVEHSLMAVPENNYQPRFDDPRVGYFFTQVTDMTSTEAIPYRDLIHRWNLVKKDPNAKVSEPVKPIVWWIENSTPLEFRETIKEAVLEWNLAFEQAGFKNAIQVNVQPDDADWDAGDIRYNVLRWTSSPEPPFGGYGPSFVNPRTGEILGADIMLEYVYHTNRVKYDRLFTMGAHHNTEVEKALSHLAKEEPFYCSLGHVMHENSLFGQAMLTVTEASDNEMKGMRREAMKELVMHEIGHTLGLNHNMKASQRFSPAQLNDPEFIKGKCLTGSVMDYTTINVTNDKANQGHYFSTTVGPYDKWAISFGYTPVSDVRDLQKILEKSTKPELIFGNDADDMRSPGKGIDPRVMTSDLSNDQITYSIQRMNLVKDMMPKIKAKFSKQGQSYQELLQAYFILQSQYARAGDVISRFIGGVYVDRSMVGQDTDAQPYTPVNKKDQKRAMKALETYIFSPDAFKTPSTLYNYLAMQRRGYNFFNKPEDPKIHQQVINYQKRILSHILHPNTLQRITDSELYGNSYTLSEYMQDLNKAIFFKDKNEDIDSFRQNLQQAYTQKLLDIVNKENTISKFNFATQAMALQNLNQIKTWFNTKNGNLATRAHKQFMVTKINNAIKEL